MFISHWTSVESWIYREVDSREPWVRGLNEPTLELRIVPLVWLRVLVELR